MSDGDLTVLRCWGCDGGGRVGNGRCHKCSGSGSVYWVHGRTIPYSPAGEKMARAVQARTA